ncbi:hypothetical protein HF521_011805 [Silurus meridionalis]|uniref:Uncharacterized protein n=1 Tax=Silurus meridionalis TaxID=175797 RepID=A0A8T0AEY1_SILME|nr:hypothetical protein HF521_011805 [Silurus meridionalis]
MNEADITCAEEVLKALKPMRNATLQEAREVEETDQSKDVEDHLSDYEDGSAFTSLQPIKRPRKSCTLADLLGILFATSENNMAPKSAHDTAASEIKRLRQQGKEAAQLSLGFFWRAFDVRPSDKMLGRLKRLEKAMKELYVSDEEEEFVNVRNSGLMMYKGLYNQLYEH